MASKRSYIAGAEKRRKKNVGDVGWIAGGVCLLFWHVVVICSAIVQVEVVSQIFDT